MKDPAFAKFVLLVNGAVPLAMLGWDAYWKELGANPVNSSLHITGTTALVFIVLTLTVTPARKLTGWNWLSHFRRMLGLYAFFYGVVHLSIYFALDQSFSVPAVIRDTLEHRYVLFGMAALALMAPLAATSTNGMIKRLGAAKWKRLHQLVYLSAIAAVVHYLMIGKLVGPKQKGFAAAVAILLAYRLAASRVTAMRKTRLAAGSSAA
ncbi:MAG: protein-methionine-sulfoxide reductase heme-binding subunit MsrQ [Tepidisphaeraceae bacterium]|jgi:sulfoxide reductase heme-binding subunit YedZ